MVKPSPPAGSGCADAATVVTTAWIGALPVLAMTIGSATSSSPVTRFENAPV